VKQDHDQVLEELCQELYKGDWHSFLVDLKKRSDNPSLPWRKRKNIMRDIQKIKERTS
jgi:hypothetical protein